MKAQVLSHTEWTIDVGIDYLAKWVPMCKDCRSGNIERIKRGTTTCFDCGASDNPIEFFGEAKCPIGALWVQKGMEHPITLSSSL